MNLFKVVIIKFLSCEKRYNSNQYNSNMNMPVTTVPAVARHRQARQGSSPTPRRRDWKNARTSEGKK